MTKTLLIFLLISFFTLPVLAQVDTAWVRIYDGPGNSADFAYAIAIDSSGNVYVAGASFFKDTRVDYTTIKYYPNGDTAWVRRYNGPGNSDDGAYAIAIDGSGNVYVTGYSYGSGAYTDYATIKYDPDGNQLWVQRYNGPGNGWDEAYAIAVDGSGNVYVTGYSYDSGTYNDYATIKYDLDGNELWARRYNGPGHGNDSAYAIAVDGSGNVYVTGGSEYDYATIKYYPNGDTAWVRRYNGDWGDCARDIAVDGSGNVYVTGEIESDYATIKYYPNGDTAWVRRYDGPVNGEDRAQDIAVDGSGNVYVTGGSEGDYATIKYYPNGDTAWVRRYDGPESSGDYARAIAVDGSGNVYVTGSAGIVTWFVSDYATIKYDPNGNELWVRRYNGTGNPADLARAIAVDGSGNIYVTGWSERYVVSIESDYVTIKYESDGDEVWVRTYSGETKCGYDEAYAIAVDVGNVYVTGTNGTIKYDTAGNELWVGEWGGCSIAVDNFGNSYVCSYSGSYPNFDYRTIKYYPNADTAWIRRYNGPGNSWDEAFAIAVDDFGNVCVTGRSAQNSTYPYNFDYATIKYDPQGNELWVRRYNSPGNEDDTASSIALDNSGNIYVTGTSAGDYATIKYYPNGDIAWVRIYNGPGNGSDEASAIALDASGNVYVTGSSYGGSITNSDCATIKYLPNGDTAWVRRYNGPVNNYDGARAIAVDGSGNVYVTGSSRIEYDARFATIKYDPVGNELWVRTYAIGAYHGATDLAIDVSGNVYVTGYGSGGATWSDYATLKYDPDGNELWVTRYSNLPSTDEFASAMDLDALGNVYVTGYGGTETSGSCDYITIKYFQFLRGDANGDGVVDIADVIYLINYLFIGGPAPDPLLAGDANCDGVVNIADAVYIINYLFIGGPPPGC